MTTGQGGSDLAIRQELQAGRGTLHQALYQREAVKELIDPHDAEPFVVQEPRRFHPSGGEDDFVGRPLHAAVDLREQEGRHHPDLRVREVSG